MNRIVLVIGLMCAFTMNINAQQKPNKKEVLEVMERANTYFMNHWPDPGHTITTNKTRPSNIWTRSVYYEGLMALLSVETNKQEKKKYLDYAISWGDKHKWGLSSGNKTRNADSHCAGQTYYDLYVLTGRKNDYMLDSIKESL